MSAKFRLGKIHGAFHSKTRARAHERSHHCAKKCFIVKRTIRRQARWLVLERGR